VRVLLPGINMAAQMPQRGLGSFLAGLELRPLALSEACGLEAVGLALGHQV